MPRTLTCTTVPSTVQDASRAFGTRLRVALIRHYLQHPGSQADAVIALSESSANISRNTQVLIAAGVVTVTGEAHGRPEYRVDQSRVWELAGSLASFILAE